MNFSAIVSPDFFPEKKERKEKHSRMEIWAIIHSWKRVVGDRG